VPEVAVVVFVEGFEVIEVEGPGGEGEGAGIVVLFDGVEEFGAEDFVEIAVGLVAEGGVISVVDQGDEGSCSAYFSASLSAMDRGEIWESSSPSVARMRKRYWEENSRSGAASSPA
jgi:C1A family cysteine protease